MSADNWAQCPKCEEAAVKENAKKAKELKSLYGKVSPEEWEEARVRLKQIDYEEAYDLREDYEIGIWEGKFFVGYSGVCSRCGFEKHFRHEEEI